jgi:hypothetical protein
MCRLCIALKRRRVRLAYRPASARRPTLAILDEATNALEARAEIAVLANRHVPLGEPAQA